MEWLMTGEGTALAVAIATLGICTVAYLWGRDG
jgi:hypothetical protein